MMNNQQQRFYPTAASPQMQKIDVNAAQQNSVQFPYQVSVDPQTVQQAMSQAAASFNAQRNAQSNHAQVNAQLDARRKAQSFNTSISGQAQQHGAPVGLGSIGLGADAARMAAARASMPGGVNYNSASPSPNPQVNSPNVSNARPGMNGSSANVNAVPVVANGALAVPNKES